MARKVGYLRVSTHEQCVDRQSDGLLPHCDEIHVEKLSAVSRSRPVYESVIASLSPGDTFIVWDLDRAYRSAIDALAELEKLRSRGVEFRILNMNVDTTTPMGWAFYAFASIMAEVERRTLSQRTKEGLAAARRRGKRLGRPPKLTDAAVRKAATRLKRGEKLQAVAGSLDVAPWTLSRALSRRAKAALTAREGSATGPTGMGRRA
ncbi:recombinase family protein [Phenylobacterium sp.]|uniref:recombinase family protein n=1 Tax=Phenylobacterium sp. TaxID=1871053 RepID=UPI0035B0F26A